MKTNFMKKGLLFFALASMVFVTSCDDDDEPTVDPIVGNYKLTSATYLGLFNPADLSTAEVPMNVVPLGDIPVGSPISDLIEGVLNGVSE